MPTSVTTTPPSYSGLDDCLRFGLTLDSPGTSPNVVAAAYRLYSGSDFLTESEIIPYTGKEELVIVKDDLARILSSPVPAIGGSSIGVAVGMVRTYSLYYGEQTTDTDTCDTVIDVSNQTDEFTVINSIPRFFNPFNFSDPVVLTDRPYKNSVNSDGNDWLYIWSPGNSVVMQVAFWDSNGGAITAITESQTYVETVFSWPVGPANSFFTIPAGTSFYTIKIWKDSATPANLLREFKFTIEGGCNVSTGYTEVFFNEPAGGFSSLSFSRVQSQATISNQVFEDRYPPGEYCSDTAAQRAQKYGLTAYDLDAGKAFNLQASIPFSNGIDRFLDAFIHARQHYIKITLPDGTSALNKIVIESGSYNTLNTEDTIQLSATFRESHGFRT